MANMPMRMAVLMGLLSGAHVSLQQTGPNKDNSLSQCPRVLEGWGPES